MRFKLVAVGLMLSLNSFASKPLNKNMQDIANTLRGLILPALSSSSFNSASNEKEINSSLIKLQKLFLENGSHFSKRQENWKLNHQMMSGILEQSKKSFQSGHKEISRQMVKSIPGMCLACHGQDQLKAKVFNGSLPIAAGPLEQSEFALATRRPTEAQKYLNEFLSQKNIPRDETEVMQAIRHEMQISIHLQRPMKEIKQLLSSRLVKFGSFKEINKTITGWLKGFDKVEVSFGKGLVRVAQVPTVLKKALGTSEPMLGLIPSPVEEVIFLKLREDLHKILESGADRNDMAEIYYWLSLSERAVGYNLFYSLADGYLKSCMDNFTAQPFAKRCFAEYESFLDFAYSGSSGTHIPKDVKDELENYKKKLKI